MVPTIKIGNSNEYIKVAEKFESLILNIEEYDEKTINIIGEYLRCLIEYEKDHFFVD
jgi:hypothetical protein